MVPVDPIEQSLGDGTELLLRARVKGGVGLGPASTDKALGHERQGLLGGRRPVSRPARLGGLDTVYPGDSFDKIAVDIRVGYGQAFVASSSRRGGRGLVE